MPVAEEAHAIGTAMTMKACQLLAHFSKLNLALESTMQLLPLPACTTSKETQLIL